MSGEFGLFWGDNLYVGGEEKKPLIENVLYERDVICISSDPGVGKSILALQLMFNLTAGHPFLETYEVKKQCNVLYFQTEGDRVETIERIRSMKLALKIDDTRWAHLNLPGINLNTAEGYQKFLAYIRQCDMKYDVIIIDPMYTTVKGSMNNDEVAGEWVKNVRDLRGLYGCSIIILHHDNKESFASDGSQIVRNKNAVFGSVFWGAFFNSTFKLSVKAGKHKLLGGKQRSGKIVDSLDMEMQEPFPLYFKQIVPIEHGTSKAAVLAYVVKHGPCSARPVIKATMLSKATVFRALKSLCVDGKLEREGDVYGVTGMNVIKESETGGEDGQSAGSSGL